MILTFGCLFTMISALISILTLCSVPVGACLSFSGDSKLSLSSDDGDFGEDCQTVKVYLQNASKFDFIFEYFFPINLVLDDLFFTQAVLFPKH